MYNRMLVPLDGSELAEVVFPYARELAGRLGLELIFLHVCVPEESHLFRMHQAYAERVLEITKSQVQQRAHPEKKEVKGRGEVVIGHPAEEILRYADEKDVDLILIATHGRSGVKRWTMGSVADKVLRSSKAPVWLVRAGVPEEIVYDKWPSRTILVPLDGSELAESVLPHVETIAKQRGAELLDVVLVRVCERPYISGDYPFPDWEEHVERVMTWFRKESEQYLAGIEKRLKAAGLKVKSEVLMGKPSDEIIGCVSKNPFNLIVMATHGRTGLTRWAYGSVADRVLHGASSPLLLIRPGENT